MAEFHLQTIFYKGEIELPRTVKFSVDMENEELPMEATMDCNAPEVVTRYQNITIRVMPSSWVGLLNNMGQTCTEKRRGVPFLRTF